MALFGRKKNSDKIVVPEHLAKAPAAAEVPAQPGPPPIRADLELYDEGEDDDFVMERLAPAATAPRRTAPIAPVADDDVFDIDAGAFREDAPDPEADFIDVDPIDEDDGSLRLESLIGATPPPRKTPDPAPGEPFSAAADFDEFIAPDLEQAALPPSRISKANRPRRRVPLKAVREPIAEEEPPVAPVEELVVAEVAEAEIVEAELVQDEEAATDEIEAAEPVEARGPLTPFVAPTPKKVRARKQTFREAFVTYALQATDRPALESWTTTKAGRAELLNPITFEAVSQLYRLSATPAQRRVAGLYKEYERWYKANAA